MNKLFLQRLTRIWTIAFVLYASFGGLSALFAGPRTDTQTSKPGQPRNNREAPLPVVSINNGIRTIDFDFIPQRVVCLNMQMTEMMIALGLENHVIYTCYTNAEPLEQYREIFNKIPLLSEKYPSHEALVAAEPDLVLGQVYGFTEKNAGTVESLQEKGILSYVSEGTMAQKESIDNIYTDIHNLGIIFRVDERAQKLTGDMKTKIAGTGEKVRPLTPKPRVFVIDSFKGNDIWTAGQCMETEAVNLAGGINVMAAKTKEQWPTVSAEILIAENPDILIFNSYGTTPVEDKIKAITGNPAFADIKAVKTKNFIVMILQDVNESVRFVDTVVRLSKLFYPGKI
jgi:iron complex transport system substrate-binding protein